MGMVVNEVYHPTPSPGMVDAMEVVAAEPLQLTPTPPIYSPGYLDAAAQIVAHGSLPSSDSGSYHPVSPGSATLAAAALAAPPLSMAGSSEASGGVLLYPGDEHAYPSPAPSSLTGPGMPGPLLAAASPTPNPPSITFISSQESVIEIPNPLPPTTPSNWAPSVPLPPSRADTPVDSDRTPTRSPVATRSRAPSVSVESEDSSPPPRAVWCGSQEQTARDILTRVRADIDTRVGPPTDAELDALLLADGDGAVQFAESLANELTAKRIGYARYLQRLAIHPVPEGVYLADNDAVNTAFKVCTASLSAGFGRPGQGHLHHLSARDWCRGLASVVSGCIRGLLVSPDVKQLISDALILPCDSFKLHKSLIFPESTPRLLVELSGQLAHELASLCGYAGPHGEMPMFEWTSERRKLLESLRADARLVVQDQTEGWAERVNHDIEGRTLVEAAQQLLHHLTSDPPDDVLCANEQRVRADIVHDIAQLAELRFQAWAVDERTRQAAIPQERLDAEIASLHAARLNERIESVARTEASALLAARGQNLEEEILAAHRARAEQQGLAEAQ